MPLKPREGRYSTVMPLLTWWQRAESKCHAQTGNRITPAVPFVQASETTQIDGIGVDKRTCTLAGSGVPTARAAALLDVEGATSASHAQRVRLGRALTKAARTLGHLDGSGGTGVSTPRRGRRNTGIGGGAAEPQRRPQRRRAASSSLLLVPANPSMARSGTTSIASGIAGSPK